jgi:PAS domain S-box-containing protein
LGKIAFIAPYHDLALLAREICEDKYPDVMVCDGLLEEGLACARKLVEHGFQAIVSRGGTANLIRNNLTVPVIEVRVTAYDILRTINEFINDSRIIGVVGYRNVVEGCRSVSQLLNIKFTELLTLDRNESPDWTEIQKRLSVQIKAAPIDVLIGDTLVISKLRLDVPQIKLIHSGSESVAEAIDEALRISELQTEEKKAAEQLRAIMNFIHDGVIAINHSGNITVFNPQAENIFKLTAAQAIGESIRNLIPDTKMLEVLSKGKPEIEQLQNTPSGMVVTNRVPIVVNGEVNGVVATFQEVGQVQSTEKKIRNKLFSKGFYARYSFDDIMAWDQEMLRSKKMASRYAATDGTVLIQAESGCGKELFAQSIHKESRRSSGPFVAVNCSALPTQLLESELFGYVEGAFTGARKEGKPGLVELAHEGTLFLDEIGDMELGLQARLLRVLEERQVMRLGASNWIPVDIRVIAATNMPLKKRVIEGHFRADLFHRLNVLSLEIQPLWRRENDILPLADYFLRLSSGKHGNAKIELTMDAQHLLTNYPWPGNVRELRNTMERLSLLYEEDGNIMALLSEFLSGDEDYFDMRKQQQYPTSVHNSASVQSLSVSNINLNMNQMKRQLAIDALAACEGNKTKAAKQLCITRHTLDRLLRQTNF